MNKKTIIVLIIIILLVVVCVAILSGLNSNENVASNEEKFENVTLSNDSSNKKILVAYFSAQNHTENVAKKVAKNLNADIFEIQHFPE